MIYRILQFGPRLANLLFFLSYVTHIQLHYECVAIHSGETTSNPTYADSLPLKTCVS